MNLQLRTGTTTYMLHIHGTATNHLINRNKKDSCQMIYFSMCNTCFWCASCIDIEKMAAINTKCPCCDNPRLELRSIISSDQKTMDNEYNHTLMTLEQSSM